MTFLKKDKVNNFMSNFKDYIINKAFLYKIYIKLKLFLESNKVISKKKLAVFFKDDPTIIEVGAHVGSDSVEMAVLWPKGKIYAFEPVPNIFERLKFKTKNFKNIEISQAAISDKSVNGMVEMFISNNGCSSSLLKPKDHLLYYPNILFGRKICVHVLILSDWLNQKNINHIDLLWIDVQGMELNIFKSLREKIKSIDYIYTEVSSKEFYEGSGSYNDIKEYLGMFGFKLIIDDLSEGQVMGNALFKKVN